MTTYSGIELTVRKVKKGLWRVVEGDTLHGWLRMDPKTRYYYCLWEGNKHFHGPYYDKHSALHSGFASFIATERRGY